MANSRLTGFSENETVLARYAKALAHPARVEILRILATRKICICNDLVQDLPLAQATVSQHLRELRNAGLIVGNEEGARVCYAIDAVAWEKLTSSFQYLFEKIDLEMTASV